METTIRSSSAPKEKRHTLVHKMRRYMKHVKLGDDFMVHGNDRVLRRVPYKEEIGLIIK